MASQTKKITLDTVAIFSGKAVGLALGVIRLNFLARYLGVVGFGILNFATYFCSLFQVLFDFGISQLLTRELARDLTRSRELVGKTIILKIGIVFVTSILLGIVALGSHFDRVTNWAILLTTFTFAINGISLVFLSAYQAHRKMILVSLANVTNDVLISVAIILFIREYPYVVTALGITAVISVGNLFLLFFLYKRMVGMPIFALDTVIWKRLFKESFPIALSSMGIAAYTFVGPTILKYFRGDTEIGIYSAGFKIISILTLIPTAFTQVVYPIFSDFYNNASEKLEKALQDSIRVISIISLPLAMGIVILAPDIISSLYPATFSDAVPILQITVPGIVFVYPAWVIYVFLLATNRQQFCMINSLVVALFVLNASLLIIPRYGFTSLAVISLATDIILFMTYFVYSARIGYSVLSFEKFLKIVISTASMALVLLMTKDVIPVFSLFIAGGVYLLGLFYLKVLGDQEKELIGKILSR